MDVLLWEQSYRRIAERLAEEAPGVRPVVMRDDGTLWVDGKAVAPAEVRVEVAWGSTDFYGEGPVRDFMIFLLKAEHVRWMQSSAAGFDHPVFAKLAGKGIRLTNSNATAISVTEYVMAGVLDAFHPGEARRAAQAARDWKRLPFREVCGSTWLVLGMGNIGREVAKRATAFGAHVIGVRRNPRGDENVDELLAPGKVVTALPRADVVVLAVPGSSETERMVDAAFLAAMKPGSVLVNVGRGSLVDEDAMLAALERGIPETAVLDVFETEPLPPESPFWGHPRVRLNAHAASLTEGTVRRGDEGFVDNLKRFVAGQPLRFEVDPALLLGEG